MQDKPTITIVGAGLAGCEAAYQASRLGVRVRLFEMKPKKKSPAHHSDKLAELVCSNSLRSNSTSNAVGLLKAELSSLGSLIMEAAYQNQVSAGTALAVDREKFSSYITEKIKSDENIELIEEEVTEMPDGITVIATGPLTSDALSDYIERNIAPGQLHFFDAAAPIVDASTINYDVAFFASRYGHGDACYVNCPMNEEEYLAFYEALISAQSAHLHDFENAENDDGSVSATDAEGHLKKLSKQVFEGCMPVEVMASRGVDTLLFGPLKPVGLPLPSTGKDAYAVVQLRAENEEKTMYNLVGFQTHLTFPEQKRVFRMIPGLENAEFLRYGVMHRNTFINSPGILESDYSLIANRDKFFAGQMTGVEGYIESTASGFVAGVSAARRALGYDDYRFPASTMIGAMAAYIKNGSNVAFQPMNANYGIIAPLGKKVRGGKLGRNEALAERSLEEIKEIKAFLFENKDE